MTYTRSKICVRFMSVVLKFIYWLWVTCRIYMQFERKLVGLFDWDIEGSGFCP